jgi:hypothetical protein
MGVFKEETQPAYKPMATVDTVLYAVKHGMNREFNKKIKEVTKRLALQGSAVAEASEDSSAVKLHFTDH